jgi:hypothetical protein
VIGAFAYLACGIALGVEELNDLLLSVKRRLNRQR